MPVCPSLAAYKTPPSCCLQHSPLCKPDHHRAPASFPQKPCPAFSTSPPFIAKLRQTTMLVFHASFGICFPKPLTVLLALNIWCTNPSLFRTCVDITQRCISAPAPRRMGNPGLSRANPCPPQHWPFRPLLQKPSAVFDSHFRKWRKCGSSATFRARQA